MNISDEQSSPEAKVLRFGAGDQEVAILEIRGQLRDQMVLNLRSSYLTTGSYAVGAKAVSPQSGLSMAVAGAATGATVLSTSLSSTLYMATADPSTLMKLGAGVGSSVMGSTGIVGHAPFMAVSSSLPIVGPVLAVQALSTAVILHQFKEVDRKLDDIRSTLDEAIVRTEVTEISKLLAAAGVLDDVYEQYDQAGSFSNDMLIRLALVERDVRSLAERFRALVARNDLTEVDRLDVDQANSDAHSAMLASFLSLRVAYLRVCVDMQENSRSIESSVRRLRDQLQGELEFWPGLLNRSEKFETEKISIEARLEGLNGVQRALPVSQRSKLEKRLKAVDHAVTVTLKSEKALIKGFNALIDSSKEALVALEKPSVGRNSYPALVYWKDESGEHSFSADASEMLGTLDPDRR